MISLPTVALTFDDGPSEWTTSLLDILAKHEAHATFLVLGENITGHEDTIRRIHAEAHELGVHGWDHTRISEETWETQIRGIGRTAGLLEGLTGKTPVYWRPPWHHAPPWAVSSLRLQGLRLLAPDLDAYDVSRNEAEILNALLQGFEGGQVIGLHDGIAANGQKKVLTRMPTVRAVDRFLAHAQSVTASELEASLCR